MACRFLGAAALAALFALSAAQANGRFPAAGQLVIHPTEPSTLLVRATYGMILSQDAGQTWDWICEEAVGYSGTLDPPVAISHDGTVVAAIFDGLASAPDDHCGFSLQPGVQRYMVDVSIDRSVDNRVIAISSDGVGDNGFENIVWESPDGGRTLTQVAAIPGNELLTLTLDAAPSNNQRLYVSALAKKEAADGEYEGLILRSTDGGLTSERILLPGTSLNRAPFIGAIDPKNEDILYLRLDGEGSPLLRSTDGGTTFSTIFEEPNLALRGFALSPDGKRIAVGGDGPAAGVWIASVDDLKFEKRAGLAVQCLTWGQAGLYACASEVFDGFSIGLSEDDGKTFTPVFRQGCLRGPLTCSDASSVGTYCPDRWEGSSVTLLGTGCGEGGGSGGGAPDGSGGGGATEPPSAGSCDCMWVRGVGASNASSLWAVMGLALAAWARRNVARVTRRPCVTSRFGG